MENLTRLIVHVPSCCFELGGEWGIVDGWDCESRAGQHCPDSGWREVQFWKTAPGRYSVLTQFDLGAIDLRTKGRSFAVPIIIIQGGEDYGTPVELARSYFDLVDAPYKRFVVLEGAGHTALTEDSDRFAAALDEYVRPIVEKHGAIAAQQ